MIHEPNLPDSPPSEADSRLARESSVLLGRMVQRDRPLRLTGGNGQKETVEIPAAAAQLLIRLLTEMAQGNAVTLIPNHTELTTQRAADLLGVSRPFLIKEIEEGRLPARLVGTHRRIRFQDLLDYKRRLDVDRQHALDELARLDQDLGPTSWDPERDRPRTESHTLDNPSRSCLQFTKWTE